MAACESQGQDYSGYCANRLLQCVSHSWLTRSSFARSTPVFESRRIIIVSRATVIVNVCIRWRFTLLIADVQDAALVVLVHSIEPTALKCVVDERNVVLVVSKDPARSEPVANERPRILLITSRYFYIEIRKLRVAVMQVSWVQAGNIKVTRIEIEQTREVVPVGIKNDLAGGNIRAHPRRAARVEIARLALRNRSEEHTSELSHQLISYAV